MAYAERRGNALTGYWYGETRHKKQRFRRRFETKKEAEGYEAYVNATGQEPPHLEDAELKGPTFASVAAEARAHKAEWQRGRDPSGQKRLDYVISLIGALPIGAVETTDLDRVVLDLRKRPGKDGTKLASGTINRYLSAASAVLTFAVDRKHIKSAPSVPWQEETGKRIHWINDEQERVLRDFMIRQGWQHDALCGARAGDDRPTLG